MEQEGQQQIDYHKQSRQENRIWTKILYHRYSSGQVDDDKQHNASTDNSQIKTSNEEVQNDNHNNKPEEKYLSLLSESQVSDIIQQFRQHNQGECHSLFENLDKYDYINYQNVEFKIANEIMIQLKNITNVLATAFLESEKDKDLVNKLKNQQNVAFNIQNTDQLQFSKIELVKEKNQSYNSCSISTLSSFGKLSTVQEEDFDNFQLQKIEENSNLSSTVQCIHCQDSSFDLDFLNIQKKFQSECQKSIISKEKNMLFSNKVLKISRSQKSEEVFLCIHRSK
ncbi:hypothetical protein ABPG73_003526 [Tetrahymena malaccensis]